MRNCASCGKSNADQAKYCMHCGAELPLPERPEGFTSNYDFQQERERYHPGGGSVYPQNEYVPNWLVANIVLTVLSLFTCSVISLIMGAIGIGFSAQVNPRLMRGDVDGAHSASGTAKVLFWVGLVIGVVTVALLVMGIIVGVASFPFEEFYQYGYWY